MNLMGINPFSQKIVLGFVILFGGIIGSVESKKQPKVNIHIKSHQKESACYHP